MWRGKNQTQDFVEGGSIMAFRTRWIAILAAVLCFGCNTQGKWTYPVDDSQLYRSPVKNPAGLTIAVLPFREARPLTNRSATVFLYLIPLMPFGFVNYERPEAAQMFNTIGKYELQLDEDLAKAVVRSVEESGLVRRVYFTLGGETKEADLVLQGTARGTTYHGKIISYCLSAFGPLLWIFGLPAGTSDNTLEFTLSLKSREGNELWTHSFSGKESIVQGLYYNWGNDALNFATLMQLGMNEALKDLEQKLPDLVKT